MTRGQHTREDGSGVSKRAITIVAVVFIVAVLCIAGLSLHTCKGGNESEETQPVEGIQPTATDKSANTEEETPAEEKQPSQSKKMVAAETAVKGIVADYGDDVAVAVVPLDGSLGFDINGNEKFVSASMIKLLILAEFMDEVDSDKLGLETVYTRDPNDVVGGTGVIQNEPAGTTYSYDDLARHMIMYSDNTATNVLIDLMGMDAINEKAEELALSKTDLQRKMMDFNSGVENHISANDAANILLGIANKSIASKKLCEKAEGYLLKQTDSAGIAQGLPSGVEFGHKTGDLNTIRHDGGIVYAEGPYVIVVLTDIGASSANALMSEISSVVYQNLEE